MVDAVVEVFLGRLVDTLAQEGQVILDFHHLFDEMKQNLMLMRAFLKDVDRLRRRNNTLSAIVNELRELVYDADDLLSACSVRARFLKKVSSRYKLGKRLRDINARMKEIKGQMSVYVTPAAIISRDEQFRNTIDRRRFIHPIFDDAQIVGLEDATRNIKSWLFQSGEGLTKIGIVGMGGLGKTTTAQKVFNDKEVDEHFDKRMWVSVSQPVEEEKILRSILKDLGGDANIGEDINELLKKILQYLSGNSFFLVLDDVWALDGGWWSRLVECLQRTNGSSVMITTRMQEILQRMGVSEERIHRPKLLNKEDSWSLFSKIAFPGGNNMPQDEMLNQISKEIVEKCGGLPLALKAIGGIMACKPASINEWKRIAANFREELERDDDLVMASLQLSYDELPAYLKPCLLCLSIYPEDSIILKDQLVRWWIAENFLPMRSDGLSIASGEECFMSLVNRCLLEVVDKSYNGRVYTFKMHDMVRDLVIKMGKSEAFCELDNGRFRRVRVTSNMDRRVLKNSGLKFRALVSTTNNQEVNEIGSVLIEDLYNCENIRILDLSESIFENYVSTVLLKVGSFRHLTCLILRNTHPLIDVPHSIDKLVNLQVLDLSFCHNLKLLPTSLTNLNKLLVLDVSCCGSLQYLPKGLGKLSNLQVLKGFKPSGSSIVNGCRISELRNLTKLQILEMIITKVDAFPDDEADTLLHLQQLQQLTLSCLDSFDIGLVSQLENLLLPPQLQELILEHYPGEMTPGWLNPDSLRELQFLSISFGNLKHFNPRFFGNGYTVWRLEGLKLELLPQLEEVWWRVKQAMPNLKLLSVSWCSKLRVFPIEDIEFNGGLWKR